MIKKLGVSLCAFTLIFSIFLVGCSEDKEILKTSGGLKINSWSSSLGGVNDSDLDKTKFTYFLNLTNENQEDIFVNSILPIVSNSIKNRVLSTDISVKINKSIKPNETIEINGDIIVDTKGMNKSGISSLEPFITDVKVSTEEIIKLQK